jgi:RNA polymerase sigma-70 factor (ECF subfamily)
VVDSEVIRRLAQLMGMDDVKAFRQFFDLLYPRFYRLAFYYLRSDALSEEVVSDIFMKIWNNRKKVSQVEHLGFYFFRAIKNQSLTYLKRESRQQFEEDHSVNSFRLDHAEPENLLMAKELARAVEQSIAKLPAKCQMIFRLVREEGMSYKDVADLMDVSTKTVENQMTIALKKLKVAIDELYPNSPYFTRVTMLN